MNPPTRSVPVPPGPRERDVEKTGIRYRLLLIEALVFIVPVFVLIYVIQGKDLAFDADQTLILLFLLAVVLGGFLLLRQVLDSIARIATLTHGIEAGEVHSIEVDADDRELKEISSSINNLLKRLEKSTELANHRLFELLSIKEFAEAVRREKDQDGLLKLLLEKAAALSGAGGGWVFARSGIGEDLSLLSACSQEETPDRTFREEDWVVIARRMEAEPRPLFLTGQAGDLRDLPVSDGNARADYLAMPVGRDRSLAAMLILKAAPGGRGFSTHDSYILSIMIDQIALGYERRELHQELSWRIDELKHRTDELEHEVSHRKNAEAEANEANVFLRSILESSSSISIVSTDITGNILYWNKGAENIFGYRASEMVGRRKIDVLYGADEQTAGVIEETRALVLGQKRKVTCEVREVAKDGRDLWVRLNLTSRRDENGKVVGILGVGEDITERKRLEQMLLHAEKMKAIGTLAGGIAHDFNNILGGILAYAEAAQLKMDDPEKARQCLDQVLKASHRAKDLVRQILDFSRQAAQERKPIPLGPVVREALKLLRGVLPSTITMREDIEAGADVVKADATQVHQVIMNLVTNASQAMWEKGGELTVSLVDRDIPSSGALPDPELSPGPYVLLTVTDTGCGMEKAVMARIFDPYFTTKARGEGAGMGLAVAYGVVKSHGGGIAVRSEPGRGTTFEVYFPRALESPEEDGDVLSNLPGGDEHILFVDDDETITGSVKLILEFLGYRVTAFTGSVQAMEAFAGDPSRFDAVITDQTMPQITGVELTCRMRDIRADLPVILCTGFSHAVDARKAREMGVAGFLMKPVVSRDLAVLLRQVLDGKGAR